MYTIFSTSIYDGNHRFNITVSQDASEACRHQEALLLAVIINHSRAYEVSTIRKQTIDGGVVKLEWKTDFRVADLGET